MLTARQKDLFDFIVQYIQKTDGVPPSYDEMAEGLNLKAKSGINRLINGLEERGYIRRLPSRSRAIEIVERHDKSAFTVLRQARNEVSRGARRLLREVGRDQAIKIIQQDLAFVMDESADVVDFPVDKAMS